MQGGFNNISLHKKLKRQLINQFMEKMLLILSGPSGSGKTVISERITAQEDLKVKKVVTCTTRAARPEEVDGVHYNFWRQDRFAKAVQAGEMFEHAQVYGNHYGSRKADTVELDNGYFPLFVVDVKGALTLQEKQFPYTSIFLRAPLNELEYRLYKRETDSPEVIMRRLAAAREEMNLASRFSHDIVNPDGQLEQTVQRVRDIILKATT